MSERKVLRKNSHIKQLPSFISMSYTGTGDRIKNDGGWKDNLSRIAEAILAVHLHIVMVRSLQRI